VRADPPFIGIELDISDSGREGCSVSMLTITAQPVHWQETVQVRKIVIFVSIAECSGSCVTAVCYNTQITYSPVRRCSGLCPLFSHQASGSLTSWPTCDIVV
jgi:hypothetical protein